MQSFTMKTTTLAAIVLLFGAGACAPAPEADPVTGDSGADGQAAGIQEAGDEGAMDNDANTGDEGLAADVGATMEAPAEMPVMPVVGETVTTDSGLQYEDVVVGTGAEATAGKHVAVHYSGFLEDGSMFDSSVMRGEPLGFDLGARQVVQGWDEGIAGMLEGGRRTLIIPSDLGYGDAGRGMIPGGATMIFDVELVQVLE